MLEQVKVQEIPEVQVIERIQEQIEERRQQRTVDQEEIIAEETTRNIVGGSSCAGTGESTIISRDTSH